MAIDTSRYVKLAVRSNFPIEYENGLGCSGIVTFPGESARFWQLLLEKHGGTITDLLKNALMFYWWCISITDKGRIYHRPYTAPKLTDEELAALGFQEAELPW